MVKRILLASLFLFMPFVSHADSVVIGSTESLSERNLPLNTDVLNDVYLSRVLDYECTNNKRSIFESFLDGKMNIPFSAKELLLLCQKNTTIKTIGYKCDGLNSKEVKSKLCSHFVIDYIKEISKKGLERDVPYDGNNLKLAVEKFIADVDCDTPTGFGLNKFRAYISEYVIEKGIKSFSTKELLEKCKDYYNQFDNPDYCMSRCGLFVEYYKDLLGQ